jgi:superfamily II DNA or RNA helicase/HKD family nuclease
MTADELPIGLHERLLTKRLASTLVHIDDTKMRVVLGDLDPGSAADRVAQHLAPLIAASINDESDAARVERAAHFATALVRALADSGVDESVLDEVLVDPPRLLRAIERLQPDGSPRAIDQPLTPLGDTTVLTNAPGEPKVGYELRAEIASADRVDVVMAFIRWSGVRPLIDVIRRHCADGKRVRVLTTTYTGSTEQRALDELRSAGAEIRVSYDTTHTRLHAKAWIFHRETGFSTAYVGSSNLTASAQISGLEWNVRIAAARNPDAVEKVVAVFESYWDAGGFVEYVPEEFAARVPRTGSELVSFVGPVELELRPFQEGLLEQLELAREQGHRRNLLVAATGTGKTVMAAVDYARLRKRLPRDRLLFVAHRKEILEQSLLTYRLALRDASFGELWVGDARPARFEHVFASVQSLNATGLGSIEPSQFDVVVVDEFHHAPAPSYERILDHLQPRELLGLTATPERSDGLDVLRHFEGRIAAELRLWDAIDQQYLAPFSYYGVHDGLDLTSVPWRRGQGYDVAALTNVMTADHVWARRVIEKLSQYVGDPASMRALGFCVSISHAQFMAAQFAAAGLSAVAISGETDANARRESLERLRNGTLQIVFSVDLFNEGVDVRDVDTLLLLRPTDSPVLFIQQLGRGLRKAEGKICTVLDFVGNHRKEFRFDRRFRALVGGTRRELERQVQRGFPFLPAGCTLELEPKAQEEVLRSIREAVPGDWRSRRAELASLAANRDIDLRGFLEETDLELEDIYASGRSWTELRRSVGLVTEPAGPAEPALLRALGRMLHIDDPQRLDAYRSLLTGDFAPDLARLSDPEKRLLRMAAASLGGIPAGSSLDHAVENLWQHAQVRREFGELLDVLPERVRHATPALGIPGVPLRVHARYTRTEILAAFGVGDAALPPEWREGVRWNEEARTDVFAFTLDKSDDNFSPTTRYRDYAISPTRIHWESQSTTSSESPVGLRYRNHQRLGTNVVLFARLRASERAFWSRPGELRSTRRQSSHRVRLGARAPPSCRPLHGVCGRRGVTAFNSSIRFVRAASHTRSAVWCPHDSAARSRHTDTMGRQP